MYFVTLILSIVVLAFSPSVSAPPELQIADAGRYDFSGGGNEKTHLVAEGLSGFVLIGDGRYLAISDRHSTVHFLTIKVDSTTGKVKEANFGTPLALRKDPVRDVVTPLKSHDSEGLIYDGDSQTVLVANERTETSTRCPSLARYSLKTGHQLSVWTPPAGGSLSALARVRFNRGFESLTAVPDVSVIWTANEEAVEVDGPRNSTLGGAFVRLLKLDRNLKNLAQYAYSLEPVSSVIRSPEPLVGREVGGLVELLVLPDGRLLAMERELSGNNSGRARFRIRLFLVRFQGATDVSSAGLSSGLKGKTFVPVTKSLLLDLDCGFSNSNFEGMALGPVLENGDLSLLLLADNDSGTVQALHALRVKGLKNTTLGQ